MPKKIAIVTGASKGIGAGIAHRLAEQNYALLLNYRNDKESAQAVAASCKQLGSEKTILFQGDVANPDDCNRMVKHAIEEWGAISCVVNNAANTHFVSPSNAFSLSGEDFISIYKVNLVGTYQMMKEAKPYLQKANGSIINISSTASLNGIGSSPAYAASKGALNTLTLSFAKLLAPHIRVNAICPGIIDTDWWNQAFVDPARREAFLTKQKAKLPLQKLCSVKEIADMTLHLAESESITGEIIRLNAGAHLGRAVNNVAN